MTILPKHSTVVNVRLTVNDKAVIVARATKAGLSLSEYMRRAAMGFPVAIDRRQVASPEAFKPPAVKGNPAMQRFLSSAAGEDPA